MPCHSASSEKQRLQDVLGTEEESMEVLKRQIQDKRKSLRLEKLAIQYQTNM